MSEKQEQTPIQASYDAVATEYAAQFNDELSRKPFDRGLLDRFAATLQEQYPQGSVWELGCGPGQIARYLQERGLALTGLDLSEQMIASARQLNPTIPLVQGTMLALPVPDGALSGIVAFYSIIHLTRAQAPEALREFWRALHAGGHLLLAFHGGEGELHTQEWFGKPVDVTATLYTGREVEQYAQDAGFTTSELLERPPYDFEHQSQRIYFWACKP